MKPARHLISLLLVCSGVVLVQGISDATTTAESRTTAPTSASTATGDRALAERLRDNARGSVSLSKEPATQHVGFVAAGLNGDLMPGNNARATDKAAAFLDTYGPCSASPTRRSCARPAHTDKYGTTVAYKQVYNGVPVFGGTILTHFDSDGDLTAVNGTAVPNLSLSHHARPQRKSDRPARRSATSKLSRLQAATASLPDTAGIRARPPS